MRPASNTESAKPPVFREHSKISAEHLQRLAYVYVRQSSPRQVEHNRESQENQYRLVERAQALGWRRERIEIIDRDLGQSGRSAETRTGFQELSAAISLGQVGILFGYDVSRLARNNSDWYRLLDLAALFGTLIADCDGVYDPRQYNDRLLLGLKGAISEAELHTLRLRLDAGRMNQVRKGSFRQCLPTGLARLADGSVTQDPDEAVRHTLELVFRKLGELGSVHQVQQHLTRNDILLPRRQFGGPHSGELLWKHATDSMLCSLLHNPAYAGAFAYGRRHSDSTSATPGSSRHGSRHMPMEDWVELQQGVYPAYITWEQFLANQARLRQNRTQFEEMVKQSQAQGAAREGAALLQGLVVCGECGLHMSVVYKRTAHYTCESLQHTSAGALRACQWVQAQSMDDAVVGAFFEALQPAQLDALEDVLAAQRTERDQLTQHWHERLRRARYEAHLAERQYNAVDPDNRLVASTLEERWEEKLRQLHEVTEAYQRFQEEAQGLLAALPPEMREQFRHLSESLPDLWRSGRLSKAQKKELLRTLIAQVIIKRIAPDQTEVKIVWISGYYTTVSVCPPIHRDRDVTGYDALVDRIVELSGYGLAEDQMATQLTREGFHSARSKHVTIATVHKIRVKHDLYRTHYRNRRLPKINGHWTTAGLGQQLGVSGRVILRRIYSGVIDPKYVSRDSDANIYLIDDDPKLLEFLRQALVPKRGNSI